MKSNDEKSEERKKWIGREKVACTLRLLRQQQQADSNTTARMMVTGVIIANDAPDSSLLIVNEKNKRDGINKNDRGLKRGGYQTS